MRYIFFLSLLVLAILLSVSRSFGVVTGHYKTNGKGCYAAKSVIGGRTQVCNCFPNEQPIVVGSIITSISTCSADTLELEDIEFIKMPGLLQKRTKDYLNSYRLMLLNMNTPKSVELAELISNLFDIIRSQSAPLFRKCEIRYLEIYDSMDDQEKDKITKWLDLNVLD